MHEFDGIFTEIVCLCLSTSANEFCVTETLENIENVIGKVDLAHVNADTVNQIIQNVSSNATKLACSDCVKEVYNLGIQNFPDQVSQAKGPFEDVCGASFVGEFEGLPLLEAAI